MRVSQAARALVLPDPGPGRLQQARRRDQHQDGGPGVEGGVEAAHEALSEKIEQILPREMSFF